MTRILKTMNKTNRMKDEPTAFLDSCWQSYITLEWIDYYKLLLNKWCRLLVSVHHTRAAQENNILFDVIATLIEPTYTDCTQREFQKIGNLYKLSVRLCTSWCWAFSSYFKRTTSRLLDRVSCPPPTTIQSRISSQMVGTVATCYAIYYRKKIISQIQFSFSLNILLIERVTLHNIICL